MSAIVLTGNCRDVLPTLPEKHFHTCVTSPPYFGLRDYGVDGQMGLEPTPDEFVAELVKVFREVRRTLRDDGTVWLNLGDSYSSGGRKTQVAATLRIAGKDAASGKHEHLNRTACRPPVVAGLDGKQLIGIPWRVAFALQADGWFLRQDIIWSKPNPMPESVTDRCTSSHEYIFLLSKNARYFYDADAIKTPASDAMVQQVQDGYNGRDTKNFALSGAQSASGTKARIIQKAREKIDKLRGHGRRHAGFNDRWDALSKAEQQAIGSNKRSVWTVADDTHFAAWMAEQEGGVDLLARYLEEQATKPDVWTVATQGFPGAHFATFPPKLIEPCILAGCPPGGRVLDPFAGPGTTGLVADRLQRNATLIELSPKYAEMARNRIADDAPLLQGVEPVSDNAA